MGYPLKKPNSSNLYKQVNIWKKVNQNLLYCYRVFERLSDNYFAVQSKDFITVPSNEKILQQQAAQLIELFLEVDIDEREQFFPTIEDAIINFEKE